MKFLKKLNLTVVVFCVCCIAFVAFLAYNPSHAYFEVHKDAIGVNTAKVDLLFDKYDESVFTLENNEDSLAEEDRTYKGPELNQSAEWGTEANPYIIRKKNHINNLAMLQKAGYFADKSGQSYFVVCDLVGKPVAINCSEDSEMEIAPIGTPDNPFTGNISGAYISGTATYGSYSVSQSTIANLTVNATESTPDIGFFGRLGYNGTITPGTPATETTNATPDTLDGFAAKIDNLLFADITIQTTQTPGDFETWWNSLVGVDTVHAKCNETHHVGIIAGHAEWATITNTSVYYSSDSVSAFQLSGDVSTNYYSVVALFGTVDRINPTYTTATDGTVTIDSTNAVSDKDLSDEIITGGGGGESGMLTGYMLSENIFDRNTNTSGSISNLEGYYNLAYDTKDLQDANGSIFEYVDVDEGNWFNQRTYRYYYFRDAIFTFAMSARGRVSNGTVQDSDGKVDFLVKIWDLKNDGSGAPIIKIANSLEESEWAHESNDKSQALYTLNAVSPTDLKAGDVYILAYRGEDGTIYTFKLDSTASDGYVSSFTLDPIELVAENNTKTTYVPKYITDGDTYILYNRANEDTGFRIPKIVDSNGVETWYQPQGYLLYRGIEAADGTVTYASTPVPAPQTGTYMYFKDIGNNEYEATYIDTNDENKIKTEIVPQRMEAEDENGNPITYVFRAEKVYLGLQTIYVADNGFNTTENSDGTETTTYYFSKGIKYVSGKPLTAVDNSPKAGNSFGITAASNSYANPSFGVFTNAANYDTGTWGNSAAYWYNWSLSQQNAAPSITNLVTVSGVIGINNAGFLGWNGTNYYYHTMKLFFKDNVFTPQINSNHNNPHEATLDTSTLALPTLDGAADTFLVFKVDTGTGKTVTIPGKNWEVIDEEAPSFDASTHVLFFDKEADPLDKERSNNTYTITPIAQLKWNNGKGEYLTSLNHAVRLAQATQDHNSLNFKNLVGDNLLGNILQGLLGSSSGGMVPAPIGENDAGYTIPAGMIAFDILKASVDEPSYINIIVAVNPEQTVDSWIGLYGPMGENEWNSEFTLSEDAIQRFDLPKSIMGIYNSYLGAYATKVSGYYTIENGEYVKKEGPFYTYLGGEVVYVAYTFDVTEPGVYLLGSSSGPMTVAYFSVDGAAGAGGDGTGGSPLGDVDFVYDNGTDTIITVDKKFSGSHIVEDEDPTQFYYPSYYYVRLMPSVSSSITIPSEDLKVRRYLGNELNNRRRYIKVTKTQDGTVYVGLLDMYEDNLDPNSTGAPPTS